MKAKLKEIYSIGLANSLEEFWPSDESNFGISMRLMIGPEDSAGSESFDVFVCTPDWIKSQYAEEGFTWGRHMLVVLEYDLDLIKREIERYIANCEGKDWLEIARKLNGMGAWEFENYEQ